LNTREFCVDLADMKRQVVAELRADKRKAGLFAVLTVVAAFLAVRLAVTSGGGKPLPAKASASDTLVAVPVPCADSDITVADRAAEAKRQTEKRNKYIRELDPTIARDIFEPNHVFFPARESRAGQQNTKQAALTDEVSENQRHEKFIREQADALRLQSTILGSIPRAIINDRVLRIGDSIDGFEVVKITSQSCVVRKEEVEVHLGMNE